METGDVIVAAGAIGALILMPVLAWLVIRYMRGR
jgi:hypothetical protein